MQSKGKYSVIYSTRIDPRVIATMARGFESRKKKFRTASGLMNDALNNYAEILAMLVEDDTGEDIRFYDSHEALAYLTNDIRLETKQVRDVAKVKDDIPYQKEMVKATEQQRIREAINMAEHVDDNPALKARADELAKTSEAIRKNIDEENGLSVDERKRELLKKQKESAQETK